jgi:hypothetical protein
MMYDPERAAIIQNRLDIGQLLDDSAELSFLDRATFRMELLGVLDDLDADRVAPFVTLEQLSDLHGRVKAIVAMA